MTWAQDQRQRHIRDCLTERGQVNRSDLMATFGISSAQASLDLRRYQREHPGAVTYDATRKAYIPTPTHDPIDPDEGEDTRL